VKDYSEHKGSMQKRGTTGGTWHVPLRQKNSKKKKKQKTSRTDPI